MADNHFFGQLVVATLPKTYRVRLPMLDAAGVGVAGLAAGLTIYRSRRGEGAVLITPTVVEISAANMPGVYELTLAVGDVDRPGMMSLVAAGAGADDTFLHVFVVERSAWAVM